MRQRGDGRRGAAEGQRCCLKAEVRHEHHRTPHPAEIGEELPFGDGVTRRC